VPASAMRLIACAGALATGLLLGGAGTGISMADPDETTSSGSDGASAAGNVDVTSDGAGGEAKPDSNPPTSTLGSGRDVIEGKPSDDEETKPEAGFGWPKFKHSLSIPVFRLPKPEEVTATGWPDPSVFFDNVEVPVPSIDGFLSALSQPTPEPTPGPAFRGQLEEPQAPVIDVTGGGGGGVEAVAAEGGAPPVFEVPLVMAPTIPIPGIVAPTAPLGASTAGGPPLATGAPTTATGAPTTAAGANAPLIRGSLSPRAELSLNEMTPMSGQATRVGYPRYLQNPTVGQLAAVALPGVGGLMFLTFSGGVIGYRQANSIRFLRTAGAERFLQ
jgi:hypothetical protein